MRVEPGVTVDDLTIEWAPDRAQRIALAVSGVAAVVALFIIVIDPGVVPGRSRRSRPRTVLEVLPPVVRRLARAALTGGIVAVTVDPLAGAVAAVVVAVVPRPEWVALAGITGGFGLVIAEVVIDRPAHGIGWPAHFAVLHVPVTALIVGLCAWLVTAPADD